MPSSTNHLLSLLRSSASSLVFFALRSGVLNFCSVSVALYQLGYTPIGCRIDSGDLAYLSRVIYDHFCKIKKEYGIEQFDKQDIIASGDIDEETIYSLNEQGHKLTCFGIGTKLVTCQKQSALGAVYKVRLTVKSKSNH